MLVAKGLTKKYANLTVVNNVSLKVDKGDIIAITGPSGAGKSSLLHLLGSLDLPDNGSVTINDINIFSLSAKKQALFRNKNIGFVFQFHHLLPEFSAVENVAMPLWISGINKQEALKEATALLTLVGLQNRLNNKPGELSGGEQQRVAIARALVNKPSIILADEPTGNLDSANAEAIHNLFVELRDKIQQTFIIVTHNNELARMTDKILVMKDGNIKEVINTRI